MEKLTGSRLLSTDRLMMSSGKSKKEIVIACGYGREDRDAPNYTAYHTERLKALDNEKRCEVLCNNVNKRRDNVLHYLLSAIEYRKKYEHRNDWADRTNYGVDSYSADDNYIVRYYGERIALFTQTGVQFFIPSVKSASVKRRINAIMEHFLGVNLYQKKGKWYVVFPMIGDVEFTDGMHISYPGLD